MRLDGSAVAGQQVRSGGYTVCMISRREVSAEGCEGFRNDHVSWFPTFLLSLPCSKSPNGDYFQVVAWLGFQRPWVAAGRKINNIPLIFP